MNLLHDLKNIFHITVIFQCFFFFIFLLSQKNRNRQRNLILAAFLLTIAFTELGGVFSHFRELKGYLLNHCPFVLYIDSPFPFLAAPILYFYVLSVSRKAFKFRKTHLLHLAPFLFVSFLTFLKYHSLGPEKIRQMAEAGSLLQPIESLLYNILAYGQFFGYVFASFIVLNHYRTAIKNVYSFIGQINLSWLNLVLSGLLAWKSLEFIEYILWIVTQDTAVVFLYYTAQIFFLTFLTFLFFRGLKQPEVFALTEENNFRRKYEKTLLPDEHREEYAKRLRRFMQRQKPYLEPSLSLSDLAKMTSIPPHHLSQVLNTSLNQNFFDFVNSYRIQESQRLLTEQDNQGKTILEILYETGFNSKSVFNTAFKKYTGMTPSQFRRLQNS